MKAHHRVLPGQVIEIKIPPPETPLALEPEPIPLTVVYEDSWLVVVDKPAGMVVHPAQGNPSGTLAGALLYHCGQLSSGGHPLRPGIVHRLDKDSSGLLVAAKDDFTHTKLSEQFANRRVEREYWALVWGRFREREAVIEAPVGRRLKDRKRMGVTVEGKEAITRYRVIEEFDFLTLLSLRLGTGRTHQIRVHLSYRGFPVVGDLAYGHTRTRSEWPGLEPGLRKAIEALPGQALHAYSLGFDHPQTGERITTTAEPPAEMAALLAWLRDHDSGGSDVPR